MEELAAKLQEASQGLTVVAAFLTLLQPDLEHAVAVSVAAGAEEIHVLPLFFFSGKHVLEDIPALFKVLSERYPNVRLSLKEPLGRHPRFFDLLRQAGGFG